MQFRAWHGLGVALELGLLLLAGCGRSEVFFGDGLPPGYSNAGSSGLSTGSSGGVGSAGANGGGNGGLTGGQGNGSSTGPSCREAGLGNPSGDGCASCPKPKVCGEDPLLGMGCQFPCQQTSDCPQLYTVCNGTFCQTNLCDSASGDGSRCDAIGNNDGICIYGLCYQTGTSTQCCDPSATRCDLGEACANGLVCVGKACGAPCSFSAAPCGRESPNMGVGENPKEGGCNCVAGNPQCP